MMGRLKLRGVSVLVACALIVSVFLAGVKLMNPSEVHIYLEGEETILSHVMSRYSLFDALMLVATSLIAGMSVIYLALFDDRKASAGELILESRLERWERIIPTLKMDEQKVLRAVLDSEGIIAQSDLTGVTGVSKSNVSRALDLLESRGFVERRRRGMGNVILLK
jgi:DNA-binding transcriptional ArsR family regulator